MEKLFSQRLTALFNFCDQAETVRSADGSYRDLSTEKSGGIESVPEETEVLKHRIES